MFCCMWYADQMHVFFVYFNLCKRILGVFFMITKKGREGSSR